MKISVITPTYNSEKTIASNINSIVAQTYENFEQIIVDNLSSDSTLTITKEIYSKNNCTEKLIIISEKDEGIADAFNKGISKATGDIVTILNSDDSYFYFNLFKDVIKIFEEKKVLFVHGDILFKDRKFGTNLRRPLMCDIRIAMPFNHPTMFFKKDIFKEIGLFDKSFRYSMDFEFICRLIQKYDLGKVGYYFDANPMVVMRAGGASWNNEIKSIKETKRALKKHNLWNLKSFYHYSIRIIRTYLKKVFAKLGLNFIVKLWRKFKWSK
ncbi:Glycosyltransferase [Ignavibacterium album JCM 16511]|uniref:Glycosyltransferase n=1 Tax=Ignavibacterium album (strain DSM 19864 / JCM 16511 / NBRC 101810 / Mat9-16) TaxID=945713 RepID=I0AP65_IGNAJ|nr:glycosyltransferase family 2 protein [Ignavibacterium album]AFH50772.1 Glycosyltransferase [Ignavibacterium album JCM 16511]